MRPSNPGSRAHSSGSLAVSPRLLNLQQTADYLGCSYWTARDVRAVLRPVRAPVLGGRAAAGPPGGAALSAVGEALAVAAAVVLLGLAGLGIWLLWVIVA